MLNKARFSTLILFIFIVLLSCSNKGESIPLTPSMTAPVKGTGPSNAASNAPTPAVTAPNEAEQLKAQIKKMTLDEKIGQLVIIGVDGKAMDGHARQLIDQYHVSGVILYKNNIENIAQTVSFLNELKKANATNKIPLFLSVDQEGGRVSRLPDELAKLPTNQTIGQINNTEFSYKIGAILGKELMSVGFNMDFAPVLDINSNPNNPVIGDRSFGPTANVVRKLGVQTMLGIQAQRIIPVVKHFPGHGDTSVDSHLDLPIVNASLSRLRKFEWVPFSSAINNNADAVMIAHILLPQIDPTHPASFSKKIITDLLRKELKFNGVVITDDMTMGGIVNHYDLKEAAVNAVNAGSDLILVAHDYAKELEILTNLKKKAENGTISAQTIDQSVYRILQLKKKYGLTDLQKGQVEVDPINSEIRTLLNKYMK